VVLMPSSPFRAEPSGGKQQRSPVICARNHACPLCRGALLLRATWERSGPSITSEAQCRETLTSTWRRDSGTGGDGLDDGALLSGGVRYVDVRNGA